MCQDVRTTPPSAAASVAKPRQCRTKYNTQTTLFTAILPRRDTVGNSIIQTLDNVRYSFWNSLVFTALQTRTLACDDCMYI